MAGSLIKVAETTVSSAVASVTLSGIDSTYDVYKIIVNNLQCDTDVEDVKCRVTESGTPNTTANYDRASKLLRSNSTAANQSATNETSWDMGTNIGTGTGESSNFIMYVFAASKSGENTFITKEVAEFNSTPELTGQQGAGIFTVDSAVDGLQFFMDSGNIDAGTFTLYGLKK
tara:strand:+ start:1039 stop:1557 length:519 start_codon:yes stop_codon:yes gene_type:complete